MGQDSKSRMHNGILFDEQLRKFQSRATRYDKNIDLFRDDFETLEAMGYLIQVVPEELGGLGLSFNEACHQQRCLAFYAPALAMAVKWHICWTGIAADLWSQGDSSLEWLLQEVCAGDIISTIEAENSTEISLLNSNSKAEPADGGYCFTGSYNDCYLPPNLGRLGLHGIDESEPGHIKIVYALMPLSTQGLMIMKDKNRPGISACYHAEVVLDAAFVSDKYIARKVVKDKLNDDPFTLSALCWDQLDLSAN